MSYYVPGTDEQDPKKTIMSLQQAHEKTAQNESDIADNTADIATNTANIASNTAAIAAINAAGYVVGPASSTANGFAVYNGTTGKLIKDHAATIALASEVSGTLPVANGGTNYTGGAWSTYTPTVTAFSGTFTSVSASGSYLQIGKLVHYTCTITITTAGTAATSINLPLPVGTALRAAIGTGLISNTGRVCYYRILASGSTGDIAVYDNSNPIASGNTIIVTGIYEAS